MPGKKNIYLVTGGRFHDTDFARLELLKLLAENHRFRTKVGNDYRDVEGIAASDLLITYTCDVVPSPGEAAALREFVIKGGRWFALHGTNAVLRLTDEGHCHCPDDVTPEFFELLGTQFKAHPPIGPYRVDISDPSHPLTAGLEAFETVDEMYLSKPRADIHLLMETRFMGQAEAGFVDDLNWTDDVAHPVMYTRTLGAGQILYLTLGHCRGHYDLQPMVAFWPIVERCSWNLPLFYDLLRRGIAWGTAA